MREDLDKLNYRWNRFISYCVYDYNYDYNYEFNMDDLKVYEEPMVDTFKVLKEEWNGSKIDKDVSLLMITVSQFFMPVTDDYFYLSSLLAKTSVFHSRFLASLFENDYFKFDENGNLLIEYNRYKYIINPNTFEITFNEYDEYLD